MESLDMHWQEAAVIIGALVAVSLAILWVEEHLRRRRIQLQAAAIALADHYSAMSAISEEPAMPLTALETALAFSEAAASPESAEHFAAALKTAQNAAKGELKRPEWLSDLDELGKTRPDVVENFHRAMMSALLAAFLRWPPKGVSFEIAFATVGANRKREAAFAEHVARLARQSVVGRIGDRDDGPNGFAPAA